MFIPAKISFDGGMCIDSLSCTTVWKQYCTKDKLMLSHRDERDFGLETETETRVVSRPVSSFETICQMSQYQSQNLRLISKVSVSVSNFETTMQKSQSQSQNAMDGLAHHRF